MEQTSEVTAETEGSTVVVSRTVKQPVKVVWDVLMTDDGAEALLGPGAKLGSKGHTWHSHNGREGVIRSFHPLEQIRFSYRSNAARTPSVVAVNLKPASDNATTIEIERAGAHRERLPVRPSPSPARPVVRFRPGLRRRSITLSLPRRVNASPG